MKASSARLAAFSLVEVTLALGVAAFCLIAIFGLLPVGLASNHAAVAQTAANGILSAVTADLRATPPTLATSGQFGIAIPANPTAPASTTLYLTSDGQYSSTLATQSRYRLTVSFLANGPSAKAATLVTLKVSWPAPVDPATTQPTGSVQSFVALDRN